MSKPSQWPVALTIAGSDSGGGAGIQADLKTFAAMRVHGTSAITCLTAQNPSTVAGVAPCRPDFVKQQLQAVFDSLPPAAVKTGMLHSAQIVHAIADFFEQTRPLKLVVDPVMVATNGKELLTPSAIRALTNRLLPLATLVTPNLSEAEILAGRKISSAEDLIAAAHEITARFVCATLVKGGHLKNSRDAVDIFFDGKIQLRLSAPFVRGVKTHGTGCVYSAAICAALALGHDLPQAAKIGKRFVSAAISNSYRIGRHFALGISAIRF